MTSDRTRGVLSSLVWTPDGSRIYFDRLSNVPEGIFSVSVFGEDTRPILENAYTPRPLSDGSLLVVTLTGGNAVPGFIDSGQARTPRRLEPLNAWLSSRLVDPSPRSVFRRAGSALLRPSC